MSKIYVDEILPKDNAKITADDLQLPAGSVIQVVHYTDTTDRSITSASTASTGWGFSITPKYSNSKILLMLDIAIHIVGDGRGASFQLRRDGTQIFYDTEDYANYFRPAGSGTMELRTTVGYSWLDSPGTTNSVEYALWADLHGGTVNLNNGGTSKVVLMEIAQ